MVFEGAVPIVRRTWLDLERESVVRAIEMWHNLGGETFIERTKFKESNRYVVFDKGQRIDSKPLLAMAYQLQFACSKEAVPRLSGGDETRAILQRLGYTLVDLRSETSPPPSDVVQVDSSTNFWWANQSQNFDPVFEDRTLWAPLVGKNGQRVDHWLSLQNASLGDIVFHYDSPELRAVSRVAMVPQLAYPPRGYLESSTKTVGNLVLVEPVREVQVGRSEVLEELESGFGPVTADGTLRRGYFFPISKAAGLAVLGLAGLKPVEKVQDSSAEVSPQPFQVSSDRLALTAVRAEQSFLRRQQIQRWGSVCCLCGSALPEELLVGAHIKPRWACTEAERMDTFNIAMLACLFGCDALYELGYVVVGSNGIVERGIRRSTDVDGRLEALLNRRCSSFSNDSRAYFEWHRGYHMNRS